MSKKIQIVGLDIPQADWDQTDETKLDFIKNKPTLGTIASKDSLSKSDVGLDNVDNTADVDKPISTAQQAALELKVDKVEGKGLSTNDYTTEEKDKLTGIAENANNYSLPIASATELGGIKVGSNLLIDTEGVASAIVDSEFNSTSENPVQNKVIYAALGDISTALTDISTALSNIQGGSYGNNQ